MTLVIYLTLKETFINVSIFMLLLVISVFFFSSLVNFMKLGVSFQWLGKYFGSSLPL